MVSRYAPGKQEGLCFLPPPPTHHYRMMPPQRPDGYHVTNPPPTFVQQQPPNQTANQGPGIRAMAPTGPPTQSSTPPNTEIKVQQLPQPSINLPFVQNTRGAQNFYRPPAPTTQTNRMANRPAHQMYHQPQMQYVQASPSQPYFFNNPMVMYGGTQRPAATNFVAPNYSLLTGQPFALSFAPQAQAPQYLPYQQPYSAISRQVTPQQVPIAPQNINPPAPAIPVAQNIQPHGTAKKKERRMHAIPVIDPNTGKDMLNEVFEKENPDSGESSARQTPQPTSHNKDIQIQAAFAKQVAQAISDDASVEDGEHSSNHDLHMEPQHMYHPTHQAVPNNREHLAQSSKLHPSTKEFIPTTSMPSGASASTAKETPVVSAITDSVEITVKPKDRESPIKSGRKRENREQQREQQSQGKDTAKEVPLKEPQPEKVVKEEPKLKESSSTNVAPPAKEVKDTTVPTTRENTREDKRNQKKEKTAEPKQIPPAATSSVVSETAPDSVPQQIPAAIPPSSSSDNGKSKSQRKDPPKQATQQQQQQQPQTGSTPATKSATIPVPQSQPAKPNNKTNRVKEINSKGATKEGTDMDAFSDKVSNDNSNVNNSNSVTNAVASDIFNANSISSNLNNNETKPEPTSNNERSTIKTDYKPTLSKGKCVTDIVKDVPKPIKIAAPPAVVESQDEPDRAVISNDKIVQAKNEANSKTNIENDGNLENKQNLPYKEGQWAPFNQTGKKVYDKDFLLALQNDPKSRKKPSVALSECVAIDDKSRGGDINRYPIGGRTDFTPNFSGGNYQGKSSSMRSGGANNKKMVTKGSFSGSSNKGSKQNIPRVSITLKEDVKLHETDNAWRPARFTKSDNMTDEDKKTEALYKRVRGILNKLTPQKFDTLVGQVREMTIDTTERLQGVIDLVFEKAVDEPNFSEAYANMCKELALMTVPINKAKSDKAEEFTNFRKLLVTRCQLEFEKNTMDDVEKAARQKEIDECADPERKKELIIQLDEDERKCRRKSVGNIRFIGELFKQQMLTVNIMQRCLTNLLLSKDEENLECLCKLLTTIGFELEVVKKVDLGGIFKEMAEIAHKSNPYKISSRVRFMIQDTIDLRTCKWVPRRADQAPKTMDQIQKEAENEHLTIQAMNSVPIPPRKDDRGNSGQNSERKGRRNAQVTNDDGWTTASRNNRATPFSVQSDKLKIKSPQIDEPLGSSTTFGGWARGSNINKPQTTPATNIYSCLDNNLDSDRRLLGSRQSSSRETSYSSKGPSMERTYKQYDGRGSRSGSQHRSNDSRQSPMPAPAPKMPPPSSTISTSLPPPEKVQPSGPVELTETQERWVSNTLDEYLGECCTFEECQQEIFTHLPKSVLPAFVEKSYTYVLEKAKTPRIRTGQLFARLISSKTLTLDDYCKGLDMVLRQASDWIIDIPKFWDYLADLLFYIVMDVLPLPKFAKVLEPISSQGYGSKLLTPLFNLIIEDKGANYLQHIWQQSGVELTDFMKEREVSRFIADNKFDFLVNTDVHPSQGVLTNEQIHDKLLHFFENNDSMDVIVNWITVNVGDRVKENQFIRTLATAIFENSIRNNTYCPEILKNHYSLFLKYVDNNQDLELQCIIALQMLVNKLEHPKGVLVGMFSDLYEDEVFCQESFIQWRNSSTDPSEMEGKGVALKQLNSFFFNISQEISDGSDDA